MKTAPPRGLAHSLLTALALAAFLLSACTPAAAPAPGATQAPAGETPQAGAPKSGGTLTVAHQDDAIGLDPHIATAMTSHNIYEQVYSALIHLSPEMAVEPDLAERWEISDDGRVYTFFLRQGVKFHNGREFVADDVKYSIERIIELGGPWSARFSGVTSIEVVDPSTVRFTLEAPFAPFLHALGMPSAIVAREVVEDHGDLQGVLVGTGPFISEEYVPGDHIVLRRNPDYFVEGKPYLDELIIKFIPDEATRMTALRTGEVDLIPILDPLNITTMEQEPNLKVDRVQMLARHLVLLQTQQPPLNDVRVRQALLLATNRQAIIDTVLSGVGQVVGPLAPGMGIYYVPPEDLPLYETDVEQAKALLAEAGYADGFDLTMYAATTYGPHPEMAQVLQQQWKEIGVNLNIEVIEWGVLLDHWGKGTFETITMRYAGYSDPHFDTYDRFHSTSPGNASKMEDPVFDEMAQEASEIGDPAERATKYAEIQKYVVEQVPMIYISTAVVGYAMKPEVMGFRGWPNSWVSGYTDTWLNR